MSDEKSDLVTGAVVGALVMLLGWIGTIHTMRRDAIVARSAYYHSDTGEFTFGCTKGTP